MEINEQVLATAIVTAIKQAVQPSPQPPSQPSRDAREEAVREKVIERLKTSTQLEVAKWLNISPSTVSYIKNGYPIGRGSIARIEAAIKNEPLPTGQSSLSSSEVIKLRQSITAFMTKHNMNLAKLAQLSEYDQSGLSKVLRGKVGLSVTLATKLTAVMEQYEAKLAQLKTQEPPKQEVKPEQPRVGPASQAIGLERVLMRGYSDKRHTSKDVERLRRFSELLSLHVPSTDVVEIVSMLLDAVHAADTYDPQAVIYELAKQAYIAG
jgi:transcriptional regulator with XRE-family HTH domain